jgi:hypothetical protein
MRKKQPRPYREIPWDQMEFEFIATTWTPERRAKDEAILKRIVEAAEMTPTGRDALKWAREHGIQFFIDHSVIHEIAAYYCPGRGLTGVGKNYEKLAEAVESLVHEIRHAWQDYHGFLRIKDKNFSSYFTRDALIEADADAFGSQARYEYEAVRLSALASPTEKQRKDLTFYRSCIVSKNENLIWHFQYWFKREGGLRFYGHKDSKFLAAAYGLLGKKTPKEVEAGNQMEIHHTFPICHGEGLDLTHIESIISLGRDFSGTGNYLAEMHRKHPDFLVKQILRPSLADTFWGVANDEQRKLTTELRKAYLRKKLAHRFPPVQP